MMLPGPCTVKTLVAVGVGDGVMVTVGVSVGVDVAVGVNVGVTVGVTVGVGVCVAKSDRMPDGPEQPVRKSSKTIKASEIRFMSSFQILSFPDFSVRETR